MGVPQAMEILTERAALVRESLQKSQNVTENMVSILGSFDYRLSALETAMRPTQVFFYAPLLSFNNLENAFVTLCLSVPRILRISSYDSYCV